MKKLRTILQSNYFYIGLFIIAFIFVLLCKESKSIYNVDDKQFVGVVSDYKIDQDKLVIQLDSAEDLICNYYFKNEEEYLKYKDDIKYGINVRIFGSLKEPSNNTIPFNFNYKKYLNNKDIYYVVNIEEIDIISDKSNIIYYFKNIIRERIKKLDNDGYLLAFILGDKSNILIYDKYQRLGVAHLFAISGMHVGLFSAILLRALKKKKYKLLIVDIFLIIYGYVLGYSASILRCIIFFVLSSIFKFLKIEIENIKILMITIFIIIILNRKIIYDIGFLYSISTVGGIFLSNNFIISNNNFFSMFKLGIVTFLFSLPITLCNYYSFNILSILFNMFYIPLISTIIYPLSLLSIIFPYIINIFNMMIFYLEKLTIFLDSFDNLNIWMSFNIWYVIIYYVMLLLFIKFEKKRYLFLIVMIILIRKIEPYLDNNLYVYYFDVGQGDCSLIIEPRLKDVVLIDTGGIRDSEVKKIDGVITFLKSKGIRKIDTAIISHGDYDHMGDFIYLLDKVKIDRVVFNSDDVNELEEEAINKLDEMNIKYYKGLERLDSLFFLNTEKYSNENDNSNVIYFKMYDFKFLFMGDAGIGREKDIIAKYNLGDIDFIKIGHHGSNTSSSNEFIGSIKPKTCVISVGKNNRYGHPKESVLNTLDDYCDIYRTDLNGSIEIRINKNGYKIINYSP